jgi:hypothetical protein
MNRSIPLVFSVMMACGGGEGPIGPNPVSSDISTMQVGEVRVFAPADIPNGIDLPSVSSPREFILIVGNTSNRGDVVASYEVRGNLSAAASVQSEQPVALAPQLSAALGGISSSEGPQQLLEKRVREFERRGLTLRSRSGGLGLSGLSLRRGVQVAAATVPIVGDRIRVKIPDANGPNNDLCIDYFESQAVVASVSRRAILAVDTLDGPPAGLFTQADFDAIAAEFDNMTFPTDSSYFGNPTDIDLNQRVIVLFTGRVNQLTPPSSASFVGGFFFAGDFFPVTGAPNESCAQSNQAEIFYLLAPDPLGLKYGNVRTAASVRQNTRGTIAHEFVHMINAGRRYTGGVATDFEVLWLDEALAHLGEDVVGRRVKNFGDLQALDYSDVFPDETARNDFEAFFFQNFARLRRWMQRPDTSSGISARAGANLSSRGAGWAVIRYAADNFSNGQPRPYTRRLVAGPDTGVTNFISITAASLDTVLAGFLVANYADDLPGLGNIGARYQYRSYNMRSIMPFFSANGQYPLMVEPIGTGATLPGTNRTGSGTYYRLTVAANAGPKNVKVTDASGAVVNFPGAHVYVLRAQ